MSKRPVIVLDADGVLVHYNGAYPAVWLRAFGQVLTLKQRAYHAANMYGIELVKDTPQHQQFFAEFGEDDWYNMQDLDGVRQACTQMHDAGFELVCVTSIPSRFAEVRKRNLRKLELPIERVFAVGHSDTENPKLPVIRDLNPVAFADDLVSNFAGIGPEVHKGLIDYGHFDSPNLELDISLADSQHKSLQDFANWWLARI